MPETRAEPAKVAGDRRLARQHAAVANDDGRPASGLFRHQGLGRAVAQGTQVLAHGQSENPQPILLEFFIPNGLVKFLVHGDER